MSVDFESSKEAFLGVLSLIVGADQVGSVAEREFLFGRVKNLPVFQGVAQADFGKLLDSATTKVFTGLPRDGTEASVSHIDAVLDGARAALDPEVRKTLLTTARELCESDETTPEEATLLSRIRSRLTA